jgi:hypothetical protein
MKKAYWVSFNVSGDLTYWIEAETEEQAREECVRQFSSQFKPDSWNLCREGEFEVEEDTGDQPASG